MDCFVKVVQSNDAIANAYEAIAAVCTHAIAGKSVLLKVNTGFKGPARSGLCTNPDVVEGLIQYFQAHGAGSILVGDSSIVGVNSEEALTSAGIRAVCQRYSVDCQDLNNFPAINKPIPTGLMVNEILFSTALYSHDIVLSVPVIKTHMYTGATLSIKNMKGCMYKREKTKLHRINKPLPENPIGRALDYGLLDLSTGCYADYAVIDGSICMEGFGPSGGEAVPLHLVLASAEPVAADMIALQLMQTPIEDVGHINLIAQNRQVSYDSITVEPQDYAKFGKPFVTPSQARLGLSCDKLVMEDESACSACHAALVQFLRYHAYKFENGTETHTIFAGKDITEADILAAKTPCLVGNCTAKFKGLAPFCKGCPPIPSEIAKALQKENGMNITFLGHSSFLIESKEHTLLVDPFLSGNPGSAKKPEDVSPTHILVSHGHDDHIGDSVTIAKACQSTVFCTVETAGLFGDGVALEVGQPGGKVATDFGSVKFTSAVHGSGVPGGLCCGFVITMDDQKIYFAGDTGLTMDMALLEEEHIDVALLPIGDRFTMGPEDALRAVKLIKPKQVVPMHYNTMPLIAQDPLAFKAAVEAQTDAKVVVLAPGEALTL